MNRDLMLAILAMDSYSRGYDASLTGLAVSGKLGSIVILTDSSLQLGLISTESAGFCAIAYDASAAGIKDLTGTVISYRGTNFDLGKSIFSF